MCYVNCNSRLWRLRSLVTTFSLCFTSLVAQQLTGVPHLCPISAVHLPASIVSTNSSFAAPLPLLVFTRGLRLVPLDLLEKAPHRPPAIALASHAHNVEDSTIRALVRARVHVALTNGGEAIFRSATSRNMLLRWVSDEANSNRSSLNAGVEATEPTTTSLFDIHVTRGPFALVDTEASDWLKAHQDEEPSEGGGEGWPSLVARFSSSLESALSLDQLHCAYDHWNCDFVAAGEVFHPHCQRLRLEYAARTEGNVDLFKFASKSTAYQPEAAAKQVLLRPFESKTSSQPATHFVERHRARVDAAYARLRDAGATAEAPIKQVMYMLYTLSDTDVAAFGEKQSPELGEKLNEIGATLRYEDMASRRMRLSSYLSSLRSFFPAMSHILVGLALIAVGARGTGTALMRILFTSYPKPTGRGGSAGLRRVGNRESGRANLDADFRSGERMWRGASHLGHGGTQSGGSGNASQFSIPSFLLAKARNISKTS